MFRLTYTAIIMLHCAICCCQSLPEYYAAFKQNRFNVGFKSICVFDTSAKYDLTCGDSTAILPVKNLGRPILLNIWYPAVQAADLPALTVEDYFDLPATDTTKIFMQKLKALQYENANLYAIQHNLNTENFNGDSAALIMARDTAFKNYLHSATSAHRNAQAATGDFPVVIYHHGLGGTLDDNYCLNTWQLTVISLSTVLSRIPMHHGRWVPAAQKQAAPIWIL